MAVSMFILVSLMATVRSAILAGSLSRSYVPVQGLQVNPASIHTALGSSLSVPFSVVATSDDQADDVKPPIEIVRDAVANVAEKVADVVGEVRDRVANVREKVAEVINNRKEIITDFIGNVQDKVSDVVDNAKLGGNSSEVVHDVRQTTANSSEKIDAAFDDDSDDSDELTSDGGNSTEHASSSEESDKKKSSKLRKSLNKISGADSSEIRNDKKSNNGRNKNGNNGNVDKNNSAESKNDTQDDSSEQKKDYKNDSAQSKNDTDSGEHKERDTDNNNKNGNSGEKDDSKDVWSWLKHFTGEIDNDSGDDDEKVKRYLTQMSKVRGYLDAIDSSIAASRAKQSGTCPIYPVQVGNNRVTITTQNGCKIIIRLKGLTVDTIDDGREDKRSKGTARSVLVSYTGKN